MKTSLGKYFMGDSGIWVIYFFLCAISLVEVFSAGSALAYKDGSYLSPLLRQATFLGLGTFVVWALHCIPCRTYRIIPIIMVPASFLLLLYTLLFAKATNEGSRWIDLGLFSFQPSEVAKLSVIVAVALILSRMQQKEGASRNAIKYIMYVAAPIVLLIIPENFSTAALLSAVVLLMMFVGRVPLVQIGKVIGVLVLIGGLVFGTYSGLRAAGQDELVEKVHIFHRVNTWVSRLDDHASHDTDTDPEKFDLANNAQVGHANIAIASSGILGKMPGNSVERDFLAQAFSDFIFAIIIEELGLVGAFFVAMLYVVLLVRVGRMANRCERNFPPFLALGLTMMMVLQALANMLVAVGLFPVTGQPLPLISRGGTSTLIFCAYMGIILSVSRYSRQNPKPDHTPFDGAVEGVRRDDD